MQTRLILVGLLSVAGCFAQNEPAKPAPSAEPKFYHLDFVVKELEGGKVVNSRAYAMTVSTGSTTLIRTGNRVPVRSGAGSEGVNYVDVGTNIDCRSAREIGSELSLTVNAEVSSLVNESGGLTPVIRQVKWSSPVIVSLRKPTVIFSTDDPGSPRQMQLELTATPIH